MMVKAWCATAFCALILIGFGQASFAQTAVTPVAPTGERIADAFLEAGDFPVVGGWMGFTAVLPGGATEQMMYLIHIKRATGEVIYFVRDNGDRIVDFGDSPLPGIPFYSAAAVKDFWISIHEAQGSDGVWKPLMGYATYDWLKFRQPIVIELHPGWRQYLLSYPNPQGKNLLLRYRFSNGEGGTTYYDSVRGGFYFGVDPVEPFSCEIFDGDLLIVRIPSLVYGQTPSSAANSSVPNFKLAGGVQIADWGPDGWCQFLDQTCISTEASGQPAGVYLAYPPAGQSLEVGVFGRSAPDSFRVYGDQGAGRPLIELPQEPHGSYGFLSHVPAGAFQGIKIIIKLERNADGTEKTFNLWLAIAGIGGKG